MGDIIETAKFNRRYETEMALAAVETIKNFCNNQYQEDCESGKCPLHEWCHRDREEYPCNWF